uniref:Reverse transcriptase n=2 Tax=Peronospora matthiolae TaxID=2874970 RepID=A0AAV1TU92_9STRA
MGKENALPPAARGAICDIDVGGAAPIAQRVRPVAPKYREKLSDLIKGLLADKIVQPSTSTWASPIVVIIKKNGVDIRLCIDYRRVNQLTRLMVYPMPLISDLLEDLDKALWYCSLDMASGFWVVEMNGQRSRIESTHETNLSSKDNDREIETEIAMRRDHGTEREEQDNRLSSLDVNLADNRTGIDRSEATQRSKEDKPSKIDEADSAEAPVYYHESGGLFADDIEQHLAVLQEMSTATEEVTINDIQIGDPDVPLTADQQRLRSLIWRSRHLLMGKENALPPAARGAICDIDVGGAAPIAQRVRPVAPKYREKLSDLIKRTVGRQDRSAIHVNLGVSDSGDHQEERSGHSPLH